MQLVNEMYDILPDRIKEKYVETYETGQEMDQELIKDLIKEVLEPLLTDPPSDKEMKRLRNYNNKSRNRQKKRWYEMAIKELEIEDPTTNFKFANDLSEYIDLLKMHTKYPEIEHYGVRLNEIKTAYIQQLDEWVIGDSDENQTDSSITEDNLLIDFCFFSSLTSNQTKSAFTYDVKYFIFQRIVNKYGTLKRRIIEHPEFFIDYPIYGFEQIVKGISSQSGDLMFDYEHDNNHKVRILSPKGLATEKNIIDLFNHKDMEFWDSMMTFRDESFLRPDSTLRFDYIELLQYMGYSTGGKNYKKIDNHLTKFAALKVQIPTNDDYGDFDVIGFIDNISRKTDPKTKRKYALVKINVAIKNLYIYGQIIKVYRKQIESFENEISKSLIFKLQSLRIKCYVQKSTNHTIVINVDELKHGIRFKTEDVDEQNDLILQGLEEHRQLHIILKGFELSDNKLTLEFLPLQSYEIDELINQTDVSYEQLNIVNVSSNLLLTTEE